MAEKKRPTSVSAVLQHIFEQHPTEQRLREGRIWLVWDEAVGDKIATKAHPAKFHDGLLTVNVSSAPWLQQLSFLKADIRQRINTLLGEELVTDIFLKSGRVPKPEAPQLRTVASRPPTPEEVEKVATLTALIDDADLRNSLETLFLKNLVDNK